MYVEEKEAVIPEAIISEIRQLVADGVVEVMLLGQMSILMVRIWNIRLHLPSFLKELNRSKGLERIRFMTSHPKDLSDELIEVMGNPKRSANICIYRYNPEAARF